MADALRDKLKASLPKAAFPDVANANNAGGRSERPSLRVFVTPENPWRKRVGMLGGLAALLTLSFGARALWLRVMKSDAEAVNVPSPKNPAPSPAPANGVAPPGTPEEFVPNNSNKVIAKQPEVNPVTPRDVVAPSDVVRDTDPTKPVYPPKVAPDKQPDAVTPGVAPDIVDVSGTNKQTPAVKQNNVPDAAKVDPATNNPAPKNDPGTNPALPKVDDPQNTQVIPPRSPVGVAPSSGYAVGGAPASVGVTPPKAPDPVAPAPNTPQLGPTNAPGTVQPQDGVGVVGAINKGPGIVRVTTAAGVVTTLKSTDTVPSGATIETADVRVSFVLPGNGRLYIQQFSSVTVTFAKPNTSIVLNGGEIYYIAAPGGTLSLNAMKATASKVSEADLMLSAGRLTVANYNAALLDFGAAGQTVVKVAYGTQDSVAADGSEAVRKDPALTQNGLWRTDVLVPGDTIKAVKLAKKHS